MVTEGSPLLVPPLVILVALDHMVEVLEGVMVEVD